MIDDTFWHDADLRALAVRLDAHNRMLIKHSHGHYSLLNTAGPQSDVEHFPSVEAVKEHADAMDRVKEVMEANAMPRVEQEPAAAQMDDPLVIDHVGVKSEEDRALEEDDPDEEELLQPGDTRRKRKRR